MERRPAAACDKKKGVAFVEILVSIVIIASLFGLFFTAQKNFSRKSQVRSAWRFFKSLNRKLYTSSRIRSQIYRLVIQIDPKGPEQVFVEKKLAPSAPPAPSPDDIASETEKKPEEKFVPDTSFVKSKTITPLLSLTLAEGAFWPEGRTEGRVFIYYYPQGPGEEAALHFKREDLGNEWTLYFPPFQRELRIFQRNIPLQQLKEGI